MAQTTAASTPAIGEPLSKVWPGYRRIRDMWDTRLRSGIGRFPRDQEVVPHHGGKKT